MSDLRTPQPVQPIFHPCHRKTAGAHKGCPDGKRQKRALNKAIGMGQHHIIEDPALPINAQHPAYRLNIGQHIALRYHHAAGAAGGARGGQQIRKASGVSGRRGVRRVSGKSSDCAI